MTKDLVLSLPKQRLESKWGYILYLTLNLKGELDQSNMSNKHCQALKWDIEYL